MKLLKLVIVDDEPILLQGLVETYDWKEMGFEIAGTAQSGEQAIQVIKEVKPHVVLTDIRMKQITGLNVIEEIQKTDQECLFIVLSAYRDFEYAQQACDLGAFAYLLKPIEDEKLKETMCSAYRTCVEQLEHEAKYEGWEKLLKKDANSFLQVVVQKYVQNTIPKEKVEEVFQIVGDVLKEDDRFIAVCVDIELAYKITNAFDYEASRFALLKHLEEVFEKKYFFWEFEGNDGHTIFLIKTKENAVVRELKALLEEAKREEQSPVVAAISKPYKGIAGVKRSCEEAQNLFEIASVSGASAFTVPEDMEEHAEKEYSADLEKIVVNAVRKSNMQELKQAFIRFIYHLPQEEKIQCQYLHEMMLKTECMLNESYGMNEELRKKFLQYYSNLQNLTATKAVDVSYKILCSAIENRLQDPQNDETKYFKEYMAVAIAYIDEHLDDEELSIVSVASYIYLNPVYFGRVFKKEFHMTFKKYLMQKRMEKAKRLLEETNRSIGEICEQVGINNPSYFSHLFKQYTGKLPSEYKKEYEG